MAQPSSGPAPYGPLLILGIVVGLGILLPWYLSYEPVVEDLTQHLKFSLMLLPLLLLVALHFLGGASSSSSTWSTPLLPSDPSSFHRVGGSPVGIALLLLLVLAMIWYQSDFLDSWHPFIRS